MSSDKFSLFYFLTTEGWLPPVGGDDPPVTGWVRVCELEVYQGSPFGSESRNWKHCRTHPDWTSDEADALEKTYPRPSTKRKELSSVSLKNFLK